MLALQVRADDQFAFLLRPCHRLTSLQMQLKRILKSTPADHQDTDELPTLLAVMHRAVQSSQPGIASAESKLQLWNVAERLLLRRGETVELGLAEPKRGLVHEGRVYRRTRGETAWHGWCVMDFTLAVAAGRRRCGGSKGLRKRSRAPVADVKGKTSTPSCSTTICCSRGTWRMAGTSSSHE